jgi:hypothetical protein
LETKERQSNKALKFRFKGKKKVENEMCFI